MKKASQILLIVCGVLSVVAALDYVVGGILLLVLSQVIREAFEELRAEEDVLSYFVNFVYTFYTFSIIICFLFSFLCIFYSVLCFIAPSSNSKALYIALIAFGAILSRVGLVGAILGFISVSREERKKEKIEVVE